MAKLYLCSLLIDVLCVGLFGVRNVPVNILVRKNKSRVSMKSIIEQLEEITPQRSLEEVFAECDIAFSRYPKSIPVIITKTPFKMALDYALEYKLTCLVHFHGSFSVVYPDARWMRCLRVYQLMQEKALCERELSKDDKCRKTK